MRAADEPEDLRVIARRRGTGTPSALPGDAPLPWRSLGLMRSRLSPPSPTPSRVC